MSDLNEIHGRDCRKLQEVNSEESDSIPSEFETAGSRLLRLGAPHC